LTESRADELTDITDITDHGGWRHYRGLPDPDETTGAS